MQRSDRIGLRRRCLSPNRLRVMSMRCVVSMRLFDPWVRDGHCLAKRQDS
jgi:hypothetical protein